MTLHVFVIPIAVAALATPLAAQRAVDDDQASVFSTRYGDREQSSLPSVASASYPRAVNEYVAFSFSGSFGRQSVLALFRSTDRQGFYARHAKQELGGEKIGFNSDRTDDNSHSWR